MKSFVAILLLCLCDSSQAQSTEQRVKAATRPSFAKIIQGIWWSVEPAPSAAFQITDSTIYYPDMFVEYPYSLSGDTLRVHREDGIASSVILKANKDTLILKSYDFVLIYTSLERRKP